MATAEELQTYRSALTQARTSFDKAKKRLDEITRESHRLNREMGGLRRTITALAAMCSEEPWNDSMGITEACTEVMEAEILEVSTQDVVREIENLGFDMASQKNAAASVHAILSRLAEKGKIQKIMDDEKNITWRGPQYDDGIPF